MSGLLQHLFEGAGSSGFLLLILHKFYIYKFVKRTLFTAASINMHLHFVFVLACILSIVLLRFIASYLANKIIRRAELSCLNFFFAFELQGC